MISLVNTKASHVKFVKKKANFSLLYKKKTKKTYSKAKLISATLRDTHTYTCIVMGYLNEEKSTINTNIIHSLSVLPPTNGPISWRRISFRQLFSIAGNRRFVAYWRITGKKNIFVNFLFMLFWHMYESAFTGVVHILIYYICTYICTLIYIIKFIYIP